MGFGHRVYKTYDPRAKIMKQVCDQVLEHVGIRSVFLQYNTPVYGNHGSSCHIANSLQLLVLRQASTNMY